MAERSAHAVSGGLEARSERPAMGHGQPRPTRTCGETTRATPNPGQRAGKCVECPALTRRRQKGLLWAAGQPPESLRQMILSPSPFADCLPPVPGLLPTVPAWAPPPQVAPGGGRRSGAEAAVEPDDEEDELGEEDDLPSAQPLADEESSFDDFDDEFDDDFEEEENDPDWDHPDDGDEEPPPGKGGAGGKKK